MSAAWCTSCFFLLLVTFGVAVALLIVQWAGPSRVYTMKGWCCANAGETCISDIDPLTCGDRGGYAFTQDEAACTAFCTSPSPPHAARSPQQ